MVLVPATDFDSDLQGSVLTLIVRVHMDPAPAGVATRPRWAIPGGGPLQPTQAWPPGAFESWRQTWRDIIERTWDDRFVLVPHGALVPGQSNPPPTIRCRLELRVNRIDASYLDPPHLRIRVDYGTNNRSANMVGGSSNQGEYDSYLKESDVRPRTIEAMRESQTQVIHEFGHQLGLMHRCHLLDGNHYCVRQPPVRSADAMAAGDDLQPWHGDPWLRTLSLHGRAPNEVWHVRMGNQISEGTSPGDSAADRQATMRGERGLTAQELAAQGTRMTPLEIELMVLGLVFAGLAITGGAIAGALAAAGEI